MEAYMRDWITGTLGEPAEQAYKAMHLITTAIVLAFVILFSHLLNNQTFKHC